MSLEGLDAEVGVVGEGREVEEEGEGLWGGREGGREGQDEVEGALQALHVRPEGDELAGPADGALRLRPAALRRPEAPVARLLVAAAGSWAFEGRLAVFGTASRGGGEDEDGDEGDEG